jgi:hypothetical protein
MTGFDVFSDSQPAARRKTENSSMKRAMNFLNAISYPSGKFDEYKRPAPKMSMEIFQWKNWKNLLDKGFFD